MTTQQALLNPQTVIDQFKKNGVTHVVWLPDSETNWMYLAMQEEGSMDLIPVAREGESMAIAAGLYIGGKKPLHRRQEARMPDSKHRHV